MEYDATFISIDEARAETPFSATGLISQEIDVRRVFGSGGAKLGGFIAVIESGAFLGECIRRSVESALPLPVVTYPTVSELERLHQDALPDLVILSIAEASNEETAGLLNLLSECIHRMPVVVFTHNNDVELARTAISHGARGCIPSTMGFELAVAALRFVLAGGTYMPTDCLLAKGGSGVATAPASPRRASTRELEVIRALQQGKSNKVIARELNLSLCTVKVHVRNIMIKMRAKNRTDVAIKARTDMTPIL